MEEKESRSPLIHRYLFNITEIHKIRDLKFSMRSAIV